MTDDAAARSTPLASTPPPVGAVPPRETRALDTLLSSARHELRSPLQALLGFTELLEAGTYGVLSAQQLAFIEHMRTAGKDLAYIVDVCAELAAAMLLPQPASGDTNSAELSAVVRSAFDAPLVGSTARVVGAERAPDVRVRGEHALIARVFGQLASVVGTKADAAVNVRFRDENLEHVRITFSSDRRPGSDEAPITVDAALGLGKASRALLLLKLAELQLAPYGGALLTLPSQRELVLLLVRA